MTTPTRTSPLSVPPVTGCGNRRPWLPAAALALLLAGCASIADIPPGSPLDQVTARLGSPASDCPATGGDGGRTMVWTTQPYGQEAWRTHVDGSGRIGPMLPALTDAEFNALRTGVWTADAVRCAFGPPAEVSQVGLPGNRQTVWSYRYRQNGVWNSLMYVYFSNDGQVTRAHAGPDPLYDREWPMFDMM